MRWAPNCRGDNTGTYFTQGIFYPTVETEKIVYYELLENLAIISSLSQHDADEELSEIEVEGLIAEDPRNSASDRSISDHFFGIS